ncbi:Gfo/Idh/MocA family protein [Gracilibacillus alcaliphilus]|uniref:Gfo/Idh/MocA family protein n=1 Tax=Gracilibacillus alcaliphilus TaxID=1401441 RepID=UPI0019589EB5|nr:Gfo/Idh/MocA family oxidoreductase [Gracilibacillus alcaliphilus]MBM7677605.1 putative dehydrogenase [Gracilibacillus alcaliphilus]
MGLKVGIIGCGSITRFRHAPEYAANPFVDKLIFYDRNMTRAKDLAAAFDGEYVEQVESLFSDEEIQVISDCSSNEYHEVYSTQALLSGKHVLCEKPISLSIAGANRIIAAQKKSGKKLMVDHNQRFSKAHIKAKEILDKQELGKVLSFKTTFGHSGPENWSVNKSNSTWFFKKDRSGLGVAGDLGIHKIDLIHYLLDDRVTEISAFQGVLDKVDDKGNPIEVADNIVCTLRTKKGCLGTAVFSWTYYGEEDNSTTIYCEKGMIKIYGDADYSLKVITLQGEQILYQIEEIQTNTNQTNSGVIDSFIDSVVHDKKTAVTGEDALNALKVILAILESAENQCIVKVE